MLRPISYLLAARLKMYLSSCSQSVVWKNIAFFPGILLVPVFSCREGTTCHFRSTVRAFKLFIVELCKKNLTTSCSHGEESKVRLVASVQLVVKTFMIELMTPPDTVTLFSLLKCSSVSWLAPERHLYDRQTYLCVYWLGWTSRHIVFALCWIDWEWKITIKPTASIYFFTDFSECFGLIDLHCFSSSSFLLFLLP